jgi:membrane-associated phospholipid phosphatase
MKNMLRELIKLDFNLSTQFQNRANRSGWWRPAVLLAHSGDSWVWAGGLALVWLFSRGELRAYAAVLGISVVIQALFVFGLKTVIRRKRPSGEGGGLYRQYDPHSFPSGHATRAVLLAVMAQSLGPAWFGWLLTIWAPFVCLSRVVTGLHYISDIVGGMLLGLVMGLVMAAVSPLWAQWFPFIF